MVLQGKMEERTQWYFKIRYRSPSLTTMSKALGRKGLTRRCQSHEIIITSSAAAEKKAARGGKMIVRARSAGEVRGSFQMTANERSCRRPAILIAELAILMSAGAGRGGTGGNQPGEEAEADAPKGSAIATSLLVLKGVGFHALLASPVFLLPPQRPACCHPPLSYRTGRAMATAATPRSTQVFAQPSKEWVIPPKPKPGRKPKSDDSKAPDPKDNDMERKVLNRAAQRAFRERKQSQLADLHARIQAYEAGEIEKSVLLQKISQGLKEENKKLKQENVELKDEVRRLKDRLEALEGPGGRSRSDDHMSIDVSPRIPKKRQRRASDIPDDTRMSSRDTAASSETAASGLSSSYPSTGTTPPSDHSMATPTPLKTTVTSPSITMQTLTYESTSAYVAENGGCGFCSSSTSCLCAEVSESDALAMQASMLQPSPTEEKVPISSVEYIPYQAAVPIRLRADRPQTSGSMAWVVETKPALPTTPIASTSAVPVGNCSGDPSNCPACANDSFGQEFCSKLGCPSRGAAAASSPYGSIPDNGANPSMLCCGDPSFCGPLKICSSSEPASASTSQAGGSYSTYATDEDTIPADEAWRTIKRHPGLPLTSLDLLADVVARHTTCDGPPPQTSGSNRAAWPGRTLVPQSELIEAGRKRRMMVHREGLKDALDLLDRRYSGAH
ncbi:hypothetical protein CALVIDRAFT_555426 [Calocera viscosa TUFC12733]|uniref:BZIP domain-containing protein n=1 Tax=Calocera viscosa (strain TUFC12733) TaxID=1330018 RepID=A0A167LTK4_CALVF|nr:hypothetical protein CALVIDRAFT_555426 [Calocera viscosa TUFC12733]